MGKFNVGLQLFSVREQMEKDPGGTLKAVAKMGYSCVEPAGLCGLTAAEFRKLTDDAGLTIPSTHTPLPKQIDDNMQRIIEDQVTLGAKYMAIPWMPEARIYGGEQYEDERKIILAYADALRNKGIQLIYHNHDFEFKPADKGLKIDCMLADIPALWPEFDVCWVRYSGNDPLAYLQKYTGKVPVLHLKDFESDGFNKGPVYELIGDEESKQNTKEQNHFRFRPIGQGVQDIPSIIKAAEKAGTHTLIVEQDEWYDNDPMDLAAQSRAYLATLGL